MHTLLLADDSVTIQRVIELTFADEDIEVVAVSDGDQAIERLESAPPDIVLADIGMPGRDGYEVARYIRQSPKLAHIPVVLLTGAFEPVDQVKVAEVGCDGVLAKPFEPQLVIGRVKELLAATARKERAPVAANLEPAPSPAPPAAQEVAAELDEYFDRLDSAFANLSGGQSQPAAKAPAPPEPRLSTPPVASVADQIDWFASPQPSTAAAEIDLSPDPAESTVDVPLSFELPQASRDRSSSPASPLPTASAVSAVQPEPFEAAVVSMAETQTFEKPVVVPSFTAPEPPPIAPSPPAAAAPAATAAPRDVASAVVLAPAPAAVPAHLPSSAPPAAPRALPSIADAFAAILAAEQEEAGPSARPVWPPAPPPAAAAAPTVDISDAMLDQIAERVIARLSDRVVRETVAGIAERMVKEEIERIKDGIK